MNKEDPWGIIGKEVRAADGQDYGHQVLSYNSATEDYTVRSIKWSDGEWLTNEPNTIDYFKISYRYIISSARVPGSRPGQATINVSSTNSTPTKL